MILYLMRHANAGTPRGNPILDSKRSLVKEGKEQCMLMARMLSALKVQVDVIASSPLKRALQTAQFVGTELGYEAKVEVSAALGPDGDFVAFQKLVEKYADREGVLMVGHNPGLSALAQQFMGGTQRIELRPAGLCRIQFEHISWQQVRAELWY